MHTSEVPQKAKISPGFASRLDHLEPKQKVRAIVLLRSGASGTTKGRRQSHDERQVAIKSLRKWAEQPLHAIDSILERFGGQRLANGPDALGSLPVETTAAGINALAASKYVKAILEDQAITLISGPKRP